MTKTQEIALLDTLEDFSKSVFLILGKQPGQDWAVKVANNGYNADNFTDKEQFYYNCFRLSKLCHKIKLERTRNEELFSQVTGKES